MDGRCVWSIFHTRSSDTLIEIQVEQLKNHITMILIGISFS
jgi:hypothetical protein